MRTQEDSAYSGWQHILRKATHTQEGSIVLRRTVQYPGRQCILRTAAHTQDGSVYPGRQRVHRKAV